MARRKNITTLPTENMVLDALESAVLVLGADYHIRYMNPAAENLLRISQHQALGQNLPALCSVVGEERFATLFADTLAANTATLRRALPLALSEGGGAVVDLVVTPVPTDGLIIEMRPMELPARHAEEEMQDRIYGAAQEMLRGLAHEIKNPLGGLRGAAQLLDRELQRPELKDYTRVILHEVDRLHHLVDRLQGPRSRPVFAEVNIHQVLEHVRHLLNAELPTGIAVRFDYDPSIPDLMADQEQLVQVFLNLMRNAQQALDRHGAILIRTRVERYVTLLHHKFRLALRVDVVDNGRGIPPDLLPRIFLPLVTSRAEGMGMGLAIAQGLVRGHGGVVHCHSQPGETVFSVSLPLSPHREASA